MSRTTTNHKYMKKLITILLLAFIIVGCKKDIGTPESAAEKYLSELNSDLSEFGFYNARNHDNRSLALMMNEQADSIISGGEIPAMSELFDKYFEDNTRFYRWELIDMSADSIGQYLVWDFTEMSDAEKSARIDLLNKGYFGKPIKQTDVAAVMLEHENVPRYTLRYKIDSHHVDFAGDEYRIATLGVIKHPEDGYKVVSFIWDN